MRLICTIFAGLLGLAFGSFLNVFLSRWPEGESVVRPGSHCRGCQRTLAWWENVPLVSWIALRGRCRSCGAWIGWRYVIVEAAVGGLWAALAWAAFAPPGGDWPRAELLVVSHLLSMVLVWLLVALAALDAEHLWLPDRLTYFGIGLGLTTGFLEPLFLRGVAAALPGENVWTPGIHRTVGAVAGAGLILLIRWGYRLVRRREGIGLGDAKLMAMLGAWLGFEGMLLSFGIGVVIGAMAGVAVLAGGRRNGESLGLTKLPLGTFLCLGGIVSALWGPGLIAAYLQWAGW